MTIRQRQSKSALFKLVRIVTYVKQYNPAFGRLLLDTLTVDTKMRMLQVEYELAPGLVSGNLLYFATACMEAVIDRHRTEIVESCRPRIQPVTFIDESTPLL